MMKHYNVAMEENGRNSIDILISEWKPTRTFTLKHGSWFVGILPWAVTFPTAYRISGMMKKKYPIKKDLRIRPMTPLGPAVVPFILAIPCAITTTAFMKFLVEQSASTFCQHSRKETHQPPVYSRRLTKGCCHSECLHTLVCPLNYFNQIHSLSK